MAARRGRQERIEADGIRMADDSQTCSCSLGCDVDVRCSVSVSVLRGRCTRSVDCVRVIKDRMTVESGSISCSSFWEYVGLPHFGNCRKLKIDVQGVNILSDL